MKNRGIIIGALLLISFGIVLYWLFAIQPIAIQSNNEVQENINHIVYSKHAKCRMACRFIDEMEVKEIIQKGNINQSKTRTDKRGKTYAYEGRTHDNQRVRIIVAPNQKQLTIVTVIDLENEWDCACP